MAINLLGLRTVVYITDDIAKTKEWYSKVFGIAPYFDEPFYVGFNVGGYELGLHPTEGNIIPTTTGAKTYWGVNDVAAAYKELIAAGATAIEEPADVGGGIIVASVCDPWGNAFGIIYNPHFAML